ncbi:molybdate ABC transporter substrate-binding protein [Neobacillus sp. FSL H8-0543]|uniref:molybdate ABC transporter substrate-binding protein n=1 Tax=Neobacillus sp. FSL H8-0543 TaxID=2954672 RepID=UPI0031595C48
MKKFFYTGFALAIIILSACTNKGETQQREIELTISAAASLNAALSEIKTNFEQENKHISLFYNIGGSGTLHQQILQGAPVDIFLSASNVQFKELTKKGFIDKHDQVDLLSNQLVLITNKDNPAVFKQFSDLQEGVIKKIAIGTPETVPAGMYAKQTLQNLGLWEILLPKIIQTKDVSQVLAYVETGNVEAGIVYMTDAKISDKVKVVSVAEQDAHDTIIYPAGIIKSSKNKEEAALFLSYLQSTSAKTIFEKYGFNVLD